MTPELFLTAWQQNFADAPLVGFLLGDLLSNRWFRIHSLPSSKRYPESEEEYAEVLKRQNQLLTAVLGMRHCFLIVTDTAPELSDLLQLASELKLAFQPLLEIPVGQLAIGFDEDVIWPVHFAQMAWRPGVADPLLRQVADWRTVNALFVSGDVNAVAAPYDGGMDVIASDTNARDLLRGQFSDWLSPHPLGL